MAVHVTCGSGGAYTSTGLMQVEQADLVWSETLAAAGTTPTAVPAGTFRATAAGADQHLLTITAFGAPAWVAIGPTPDASQDPRRYFPDGQTLQFAAQPGDKVAWAAV